MTAMLASVRNEEEAVLARSAGVDIIDLKDPDRGALGALETELVRRIVSRHYKEIPFSATIGDVPFSADQIGPMVAAMAEAGVDFVKVGVFGDPGDMACMRTLHAASMRGIRIVLVLFAEDSFPRDFSVYARHGIAGVMLDTRDKHSGSLRDKVPDHQLQGFVTQARAANLLCGLAGSLSQADIPALITLDPDYLGFRGALCGGHCRTAGLDSEAIRQIRLSLAQSGGMSQCA
jgi:uncharacterized protein (UPF0264 family)